MLAASAAVLAVSRGVLDWRIDFVDKLWSAAIPRSYWEGTLYMLALLQVSGKFHRWY